MTVKPSFCLLVGLAFLFFILNLVFAGQCLKFKDYDAKAEGPTLFTLGATKPVCFSILSEAYDEYWADDQVLDQLVDQSPTCLAQAQHVLDGPVSQFIQLFSPTEPSSLCQKLLVIQLCLAKYPRCNSSIDVLEHKTKIYPDYKPCRWFCRLFSEGGVCTAADLGYLKNNFGVDILGNTNLLGGAFDCNSSTLWSDDDKCLVMSTVQLAPPTPRCETYTGEVCRGLFGSNRQVYVPAGWDQAQREQVVADQLYVINGLSGDGECAANFYRVLCSTVFPDCVETNMKVTQQLDDGTSIVSKARTALQMRLPTALCERLGTTCSQQPFFKYFENQNFKLFPNCTEQADMGKITCKKEGSGLPNFLGRYQTASIQMPGPNDTFTLAVSYAAGDDFNYITDLPLPDSCPAPLVLADNINTNVPSVFSGRCYRPCVMGSLSKHDRDRILLATDILSIIVMIMCGLLSLSFVIFKSQRHKTLLFFYTSSYFFVPLMIFIGMRVTPDYESMCHNNTDRRHFEGFGLFQSIVFVYFFLAHACWWLMQACDLFLRLILGRSYKRGSIAHNRRSLAMHLFSWGTPAICVSALACAAFLGYDGYLPIAITSQSPRLDEKLIDLQWIFVFLPFVLCTLIGFVLIGVIFWFLIRYTDSTPQTIFQPAPHLAGGGVQQPRASVADQQQPTPAITNGNGEQKQLTEQQMQQQMQQQLQNHMDTADDYKPTQEMLKLQNQIGGNRGVGFKFVQSLKLFGFVFIMLFTIAIFLVYSLYRISLQSQWDTDLLRFEECLISSPDPSVCNLASKINPDLIIVGVVAYLMPGFIMFILFFILDNNVWRLWVGLLHYRLGLTIFSTFALEDTTDGTGSSAGSSSGKSSSGGSNGSSDILTGDMTLRKKKHNTKDGSQSDQSGTTDPNGTVGDLSLDTTGAMRSGASGGTWSQQPTKQQVNRRKTLFKGLKTSDHRYGTSKHAASIQMLVRSKMSQDEYGHSIQEEQDGEYDDDGNNGDDNSQYTTSSPQNGMGHIGMASPSYGNQGGVEMSVFNSPNNNNNTSQMRLIPNSPMSPNSPQDGNNNIPIIMTNIPNSPNGNDYNESPRY